MIGYKVVRYYNGSLVSVIPNVGSPMSLVYEIGKTTLPYPNTKILAFVDSMSAVAFVLGQNYGEYPIIEIYRAELINPRPVFYVLNTAFLAHDSTFTEVGRLEQFWLGDAPYGAMGSQRWNMDVTSAPSMSVACDGVKLIERFN